MADITDELKLALKQLDCRVGFVQQGHSPWRRNSMDPDEVAHFELPHVFANSTIFNSDVSKIINIF